MSTTTFSTGPADSIVDFLARHRVGHLATSDLQGRPHVIPVCFVLDQDEIFIALDEKPKQVPAIELKRVRNIIANPSVALVVDDYDEDWTRLAYVLVRGQATVIEPATSTHTHAVGQLRAVYPQYRSMAIEQRPVVRIGIDRAVAWGNLGQSGSLAEIDRIALSSVIRGRRSVRAYTERPVPRNLIEACIDAAGWAPSPHGRQPWRFAVITQPAWKVRLADSMASEWRRNLDLDGQPQAIIDVRLAKARTRVLEAPVLVLACLYLKDLDSYPDARRQTAEQTMAVQSLGAALQNMLLTAYHLGLDGGWMCAPLFCPEIVVAALDLDPGLIPHALITIGYAANDPVRRPRRPLEDLIVLDA